MTSAVELRAQPRFLGSHIPRAARPVHPSRTKASSSRRLPCHRAFGDGQLGVLDSPGHSPVATGLAACAVLGSTVWGSLRLASAVLGSAGDHAEDGNDDETSDCSDLDEASLSPCSSRREVWSHAWAALGAPYAAQPRRCRTLMLEGIDPPEAVSLIALSLAALEKAVAALHETTGFGKGEGHDECHAFLLSVARAAARAWLGYVPEGLLRRLPTGQEGGSGGTPLAEPTSMAMQMVDHDAIATRLAETTALYAAVVRLLLIPEPWVLGKEKGEASTVPDTDRTLPVEERRRLAFQSLASATRNNRQTIKPTALRCDDNKNLVLYAGKIPASDEISGKVKLSTAGGCSVTTQMFVSLATKNFKWATHQIRSIRGWSSERARGLGSRSPALLSIAPYVLQDMAVTVANAVAGCYLAEVAAGTPPVNVIDKQSNLLLGRIEGHQRLGSEHQCNDKDYVAAERAVSSSSSSLGYEQGQQQQLEHGYDGHRQQNIVLLEDRTNQKLEGTVPINGVAPNPGWPPRLPVNQALVSGSNTPNHSTSAARKAQQQTHLLEASLWPTFLHPALSSTRALQRFGNQVGAYRWLYRQYHSVQDMLEDRLRLFVLGPGGSLLERRVPMRRGAELDSLGGPRLWISIVLEALDIALPLLVRAWRAAGRAATWIVVGGIGKLLGAVALGVRAGLTGGAGLSSFSAPKKSQRRKQRARAPPPHTSFSW